MQEEISTIQIVYGEKFIIVDLENRKYELEIKLNPKHTIKLHFIIPSTYPEKCPFFSLHADWLSTEQISILSENLQFLFDQAVGKAVLLKWVEWLRENIFISLRLDEEKGESTIVKDLVFEKQEINGIPTLHHSTILTDRKSVFQAHAARVTSIDDVEKVLKILKQNKRIAVATHNIYVYRIFDERDKKWLEGRDDDGEIGASEKVLAMMQKINAKNVLVVVTRWFGWILLFDDRFTHITNMAEKIILQEKL